MKEIEIKRMKFILGLKKTMDELEIASSDLFEILNDEREEKVEKKFVDISMVKTNIISEQTRPIKRKIIKSDKFDLNLIRYLKNQGFIELNDDEMKNIVKTYLEVRKKEKFINSSVFKDKMMKDFNINLPLRLIYSLNSRIVKLDNQIKNKKVNNKEISKPEISEFTSVRNLSPDIKTNIKKAISARKNTMKFKDIVKDVNELFSINIKYADMYGLIRGQREKPHKKEKSNNVDLFDNDNIKQKILTTIWKLKKLTKTPTDEVRKIIQKRYSVNFNKRKIENIAFKYELKPGNKYVSPKKKTKKPIKVGLFSGKFSKEIEKADYNE